MSNVIRLSAFAAAMALTGRFVAPVWTAAPTISLLSIGSVITVTSGAVLSVPAAVLSYSVAVNGAAKTWPYKPVPADAGATVVITPIATNLGVSVPGPSCTAVCPPYVVYTPPMEVGQNTPGDNSFTTMRVYNDRVVAAGDFYTAGSGLTTSLPLANRDLSTGLPTAAFAYKVAEGALAQDPSVTGTWTIRYTASAQRTLTFSYGATGTITGNTYNAGTGAGEFLVTYTAGSSALGLEFDGGVTALATYDPTIRSLVSGGGTPPVFHTDLVNAAAPYAYMRMMDNVVANGDYVTAANTWIDTVNWSDRLTPAKANLHKANGYRAGMPLEWQVLLMNTAGKSGWFNLPEMASDDYVTQFATYVAQNLATGKIARFELSNERWNTGGSFWNYRKAGYAGMSEAIAFQSTATTEWVRTYAGGCHLSTFSSDGTTATVVFLGGSGHGLATGVTAYVPLLVGAGASYVGFTASGVMTVVDAFTVTYPCAQASTGGTVAASTVIATSSGFLALNGTAGIFTGGQISDIFKFSSMWHYRRVFQMAKLVKDAFAAVGRQASDCHPLLALQAGAGESAQWTFGAKNKVVGFLNAQFPGVKLSDRLKAVAVGGYLTLSTSGAVNSGFGYTGTNNTPQTTDDLLAQLDQMASVCYATYSQSALVSWVKAQGLDVLGYEIGLDTFGPGGQPTPTQTAANAANADPRIAASITKWVRGFAELGFSAVGWYQCGTGTYTATGCFNLGASAAEVTPTTDPSLQSPKFKGLVAATQPWTTPQARHVVPCTLGGFAMVGNEAELTNGALWPALSGTNFPVSQNYSYPGSGNGETYFVWLEAHYPQTSVVTIVGDYTAAGATTISVQPLNADGSGGGSFPLVGVQSGVTLGACTVTLQPGPNYVFVSASANQANVFPHTVAFT